MFLHSSGRFIFDITLLESILLESCSLVMEATECTEMELHFDPPCCAVHLKLTEGAWQAIQHAKRTGQAIAMNVGARNVSLPSLYLDFQPIF